MPLTHDQEVHLADLEKAFIADIEAKYRKGAEEHGGNIWDQSIITLIDNAIQEAVDQYVYLRTLRGNIERALLDAARIQQGISDATSSGRD